MKDLIDVKLVDFGLTQNMVCDARQLHKVLGVGRDFSTWLKGRLNSGLFVEGEDYISVTELKEKVGENQLLGIFPQTGGNSCGSGPHGDSLTETTPRGRPVMEYILTVRMATHLAMMEKSEVGRRVRDYFIQRESDARELEQFLLSAPEPIPMTLGSYQMTLQQFVTEHNNEFMEYMKEHVELKLKIEPMLQRLRELERLSKSAYEARERFNEQLQWVNKLMGSLPQLSDADRRTLAFQHQQSLENFGGSLLPSVH